METKSKRSGFFLPLLLAFSAGFLSLVLQTTLLRLSIQELGSSRTTSAAILATALLGLAIGAAFFGSLADKFERQDKSSRREALPWLLLGLASVATLALAFFSRTIAANVASVCAGVAGESLWPPLLFAILVILPVHTVVGGIIPALLVSRSTSLSDPMDGVRKMVAPLYAIETVGVAIGAILTVFVLVPELGIRISMLVGGGVSLAAAGMGFLFRNRDHLKEREQPPVLPILEDSTREDGFTITTRTKMVLLLAVLLSSFASMGMELVWQRFFVVLFGSDSRSYAVVVSTTLIGVALGAWLSGLGIFRSKTSFAYGLSLLAISAGLSLSLLVLRHGMDVETMQLSLDWLLLTPFYGRLLLSVAVVLLPACCIGFSLPLVSDLWVEKTDLVGTGVGKLFAVVAIGNVIGVFCCASFLIPKLGSFRCAVLLSLIPFAAAILILTMCRPRDSSGRAFRWVVSIIACIVCGQLGFRNAFTDPVKPGSAQQDQWTEVFYCEDGDHAVAVRESTTDSGRRTLSIDGVVIGENNGGVDEKQRLLAQLPFLLKRNGDSEKVYTIGLGTGILANELAAQDCVDTVIVTELSKGVIEAADRFFQVEEMENENKVNVINDDGIRYLRNSKSRFDAIVSDGKSRPGAASNLAFFSRDYYQLCDCLLYTSPSPRDRTRSRMPSSA